MAFACLGQPGGRRAYLGKSGNPAEEAEKLGLAVEPVVIGMAEDDRALPRRSDIAFFPVRRNTLLTSSAYWKLAGDLDCVLDIGAGDSFTDLYGSKRFAFLWLTKALLVARRTPLLLAPQTIGPFEGAISRRLAAAILPRCAQVVTRDRESLDLVQRIAPQARVKQGIEVAFELPFTDHSTERGGARTRIGVNVSGLLAEQARIGTNRFGLTYDYLAAMEQLVTNLSADEGNEVRRSRTWPETKLPAMTTAGLSIALRRFVRRPPGFPILPMQARPSPSSAVLTWLWRHGCMPALPRSPAGCR